MKCVIDYNPFLEGNGSSWIKHGGLKLPLVVAFRRQFEMDTAQVVRVHISADERYELYLDGGWVGRGSERGDAAHWFFDTYDLELSSGAHVLVAKVWAFGEVAPLAQRSVSPGLFILSPEKAVYVPLIGTGTSEWRVRELTGFSFDQIPYAFGIGWRESIDGTLYDSRYRAGAGTNWEPVETVSADAVKFNLIPSSLPAMLNRRMELGSPIENTNLPAESFGLSSEFALCNSGVTLEEEWSCPSKERPLCIPPYSVRRMVFQLDDYYCVYPEIQLSKGRNARLRIGFSEAAYLEKDPVPNVHHRHLKGHRDEFAGKYLICSIGSSYQCGGSDDQVFDPLWWFSGRYVEVLVETREEPLLIEGISLYETRYPLSMESRIGDVDESWRTMLQTCFRTLQMCAHETYMDCPFYEQLMYVGDTRLEALTTYAVSGDSALPLKAVNMFHASRLPSGLTQACYPYRGVHTIPPFSLWWIAMVNDYALWRRADVINDGILEHMRAIIAYFMERKTGLGGLVVPGSERKYGHFNFVDWAIGWNNDWGVPGSRGELNSVFNWQLVYVLKMYAGLERTFGRPHLAVEALDEARNLTQGLVDLFWSDEKKLFADDPEHTLFSEHSQGLAILADTLDEAMIKDLALGLETDDSLVRVTYYFAHYYFEACVKLGRMDLMEKKMAPWFELQASGFTTVPEMPLPTRSDCHAWGAHPLFHFFASILGIRPGSFGFKTVSICPRLGALEHVSGRMIHPAGGYIEVNVKQKNGMLSGIIVLPDHLSGQLVLHGEIQPLVPGKNVFETQTDLSEGVLNEVNDRLVCGLPCAGV